MGRPKLFRLPASQYTTRKQSYLQLVVALVLGCKTLKLGNGFANSGKTQKGVLYTG